MLIHTILIYICYSPGFFIFIFYIGKIHTVLFLLYIQMFPRIFIIIINNPTIIIFMHITFSIFWILSSERFPEVKLLSQRAQILLWPFKDIAKMLFKRSLPTYNEFKDLFFLKKINLLVNTDHPCGHFDILYPMFSILSLKQWNIQFHILWKKYFLLRHSELFPQKMVYYLTLIEVSHNLPI